MKITWFGTASVLIESQETSILFDPYLKDLPKNYEQEYLLEQRKNAFLSQKNVLITHGHFDHISSLKELYSQIPCKIYLTKTPYKSLSSKRFPKNKLCQIQAGDQLDFSGVTVRALQGKHIKFVKKELFLGFFTKKSIKYFWRGLRLTFDYFKYPQKKEILFYEIEAEGKLIQVMGSAELMDNEVYHTGADLLILPHQGIKNIDGHNAKIVERLKPKRVVLDHYDDAFPPYSAQIPVDDFCQNMSKTIPTEKLIEGKTIEI